MERRSKQKWENGDIFLVPKSDGGYTVAQVLSYEVEAMNSAVCAFTLRRASKTEKDTAPTMDEIISIQYVTIDLLDSGDWPVVGHAPEIEFRQLFDLVGHRAKQFIGTVTEGSGIMDDFINACFGLEPWHDWYDPLYLDKLLLSPDKKPALVVYKSEEASN